MRIGYNVLNGQKGHKRIGSLGVTANRISITEAKQKLGELVKRAAYGGERILLQFRGKPQAALVSYADYEHLRSMDRSARSQRKVLGRLSSLRERIAARTGETFDSARDVEEAREKRLDRLTGLR